MARILSTAVSFIGHRGLAAALLTVAGLLAQAVGGSSADAATTSHAVLVGASCSSADACMAVGTLLKGPPVVAGFPLAESWNGKAWTIKATQNPKGSTNSNLYAVSCVSAKACMAVGSYEDAASPTGTPFTELWNGKTWAIKAAPSPGGDNSSLIGVSCITAQYCVAVGFSIIGSNNNAYSEVWNGKTWAVRLTPRRSGTTYSSLGAVSCRSATFCLAVGDYQVNDSSKSRTLAEEWNGRTWAIKATPNPNDGVNGDGIPSVACTSPSACIAAGSYGTPNNRAAVSLVEAWNGHAWAIKAAPRPNGGNSSLSGVSCTAANSCMTVGNHSGGVFSGVWNGKTWAIKAVPQPKGLTFALMDGVSCGARNACIAVGDGFNSSETEIPFAGAWNGKTWAIKAVPS
jgi:hypothetical protein